MKYRDETVGYSLQLPEGWRKDERALFMTTFTSNEGNIYVQVAEPVDPQFTNAGERERFMMEPGCTYVRDRSLGDETNTVIVDHPIRGDGVISAYRGGLLYSVSYDGLSEPLVRDAIAEILGSFQFPSASEATSALRSAKASPGNRALSELLHANSPADARRRLSALGCPTSIEGAGYTMHRVGTDVETDDSQRAGIDRRKRRWWEFWRK